MMASLTFIIRGEPVPKGRPRFTRQGHSFTPAKTRESENNLRAQIVAQLPADFALLQGPLELHAVFVREKPKSAKKSLLYPGTRPDLDNYLKLVLDAMNSVVFRDDSQIVGIYVIKRFSDSPGKPCILAPGISITITDTITDERLS